MTRNSQESPVWWSKIGLSSKSSTTKPGESVVARSFPNCVRSTMKPSRSSGTKANTWLPLRSTVRPPTRRWAGRMQIYAARWRACFAAPAFRVGHDCSIRCGLAGKRNCNVSSRCTWSALGSATHHGSPNKATCWSPRMTLQRRLALRRWWWRGEWESWSDAVNFARPLSQSWKIIDRMLESHSRGLVH